MSNIITIDKAKEKLPSILTTPMPRKVLLEKCVESQNLTKAELEDKTSGKTLNLVKCRFGDAIAQLLQSGILKQNENKELEFCNNSNDIKEEISRDNLIQNTILDILANENFTKKNLLNKICDILSTRLSISDKTLKSLSGNIIKNLLSNQTITCDNGEYFIKNNESINEKNVRLFYNLSDESLVEYSLQMLQEFFEKSSFFNINECKNIDGSQDGGIDGIIKLTDILGFKEKIIVQVKNFQNKNKFVPLCEIREFYGVFSADIEATKAIFITKGKYHKDTISFVSKLKNNRYLLIDGEKWLKLAEICGYEIPE